MVGGKSSRFTVHRSQLAAGTAAPTSVAWVPSVERFCIVFVASNREPGTANGEPLKESAKTHTHPAVHLGKEVDSAGPLLSAHPPFRRRAGWQCCRRQHKSRS